MRLKHIQAGRGLEVVHDDCPFHGAYSQPLRCGVEVNGGETVISESQQYYGFVVGAPTFVQHAPGYL